MQIQAISPMLIPVIAHDRAGFGGGLLSAGTLIRLIARNAALTRSFVQVIAVMGLCGFGAALGVHVAIGYLDSLTWLLRWLGSPYLLPGWCYVLSRLDKACHSMLFESGMMKPRMSARRIRPKSSSELQEFTLLDRLSRPSVSYG